MDIQKLVCPGEGGIKKLEVEEIDIQPDEKAGFPAEAKDRYYYVVSGYGRLQVDAYGYSLGPQSGVYIPMGNEHSIGNTGNVSLKLVRCSAPGN